MASADLRAQVLAELDRREAIARAASPGPWMAATHTGRKDGISLIGRTVNRGTGRAVAVFADTDVRQRAADAEHAALHDPADALRRYARDRRVLARHAPSDDTDPHSSACVACMGGPWINCAEIRDLADSLGIDTTGGRHG